MEGALDLFAMAAALTNEEHSKYDKRQENFSDFIKNPLKKLDISTVEKKCFIDSFEKKLLPICLTNSTKKWNIDFLKLKNLEKVYEDVYFSLFGGQKFILSEYLRYCRDRSEVDENPLYLFEDLSIIVESSKSSILDSYLVHDIFKNRDLYEKCSKRPPFRWLLIGPKNSGTKLHKDPYGTSAWNTLLEGRKRWILIDPKVNENMLSLCDRDKAVQVWFSIIWPNMKKKLSEEQYYDFIQYPGETIFVPYSWWHIVINLDMTCCVTQNYASENFKNEVKQTLKDPKFNKRFPNISEEIFGS